MTGDLITGSAFDQSQGFLELVVGEGLDLPAVITYEMMMVFAVRVDRLEEGGASPDVDALDVAVSAEHLQRPVDARDADGTAFRA